MVPSLNCIRWPWPVVVVVVPMLEMAFHLGLGHIVLKPHHMWAVILVVFQSLEPHVLHAVFGHQGKHSRSPNKAPKFVILFKHYHQSAGLYFPPNALSIVEKASFDRSLWETGSHCIMCGNFKVQHPVFWCKHRLPLMDCILQEFKEAHIGILGLVGQQSKYKGKHSSVYLGMECVELGKECRTRIKCPITKHSLWGTQFH